MGILLTNNVISQGTQETGQLPGDVSLNTLDRLQDRWVVSSCMFYFCFYSWFEIWFFFYMFFLIDWVGRIFRISWPALFRQLERLSTAVGPKSTRKSLCWDQDTVFCLVKILLCSSILDTILTCSLFLSGSNNKQRAAGQSWTQMNLIFTLLPDLLNRLQTAVPKPLGHLRNNCWNLCLHGWILLSKNSS